jgi:hypothetical protein
MEVGPTSRKHGPTGVASQNQTTTSKAKKVVSKAIAVKGKGIVTFLLSDRSERTQMIKSSCISVDLTGQRTRLRYIEGYTELEYSKQINVEGKHASYIVMRKGKLVTGDKTLIRYIKRHPNYGVIFYAYDPVGEAEAQLKLEEAVDAAVYYARTGLNDEEAYELAKFFKLPNIDALQIAQIRIFLIACARENPEEFNEKRAGSEAKINNILSKAFKAGKIEIKDFSLKYKGGGAILDRLPNIDKGGKIDFVIRWIMTDEKGQEFLEEITD